MKNPENLADCHALIQQLKDANNNLRAIKHHQAREIGDIEKSLKKLQEAACKCEKFLDFVMESLASSENTSPGIIKADPHLLSSALYAVKQLNIHD